MNVRRPAPSNRANCRFSNLVYMGGIAVCYRPAEHRGACGVDPTPPSALRHLLTGRWRPRRDGFGPDGRALS